MRVMDFTRSTPRLVVDLDWSPAYELLISLAAFASTDIQATFDSGQEVFEELRTRLSSELTAALGRLGPEGGKQWGTVMGLVWEDRLREPSDLIERIEGMPGNEFALILLGSRWPTLRAAVPPPLFVQASQGDHEALDQLATLTRQVEPEVKDATARIGVLKKLGPEATKLAFVDALRRWNDEVFSRQRPEVEPILRRDVEAKRALLGSVEPEKLIEAATHGLQYTANTWTRRVLLVPHVAMRPWNVMNAWDDVTIVCYPADDEPSPADPTEPPARLVRLHKALGDEKRLRMLKVLAISGGATLQELAGATGLAKSSAHHHTVILRSAGLLNVTLEDNSRYTLRRDAVPEMSGWLEDFLEGGGR